MAIPLVRDVKAQYAPLLGELKDGSPRCSTRGRFILGPEVQAFEEEAAAYLGAADAVGVANGTDALVLVLDALGVGPGDEVICPSFTFYATAEAIARRGATPVFADIDPATLNLDPADVAARVTERTKAILAVHLFGRPAPIAELPTAFPSWRTRPRPSGQGGRPRGRARSPPRRRSASTPTKNLFGLGDGGLVTSDDPSSPTASASSASTARATSRPSRPSATTRGSTSSRRRRCALPPPRRRLERRRRAAAARYAALGLGEVCELPADEPGPRLPHVRRPHARARADHRGARRPGSAAPRTTRRRSTSSRSSRARLRAREPARDRAGRPGDPRAPLWPASRPSSRSGWSSACGRPRR